jgi:Protein of unknown function (DUF4089)
MNAIDIERYVAAAAQAQGLTLEADQLQRVVTVFTRNADLAKLVLEFDLPETIEPAPIFTP